MMSAELADMRDALIKLRGSLESLRRAEGDSPYVRRLMNDLDRLQLDMEDVSGARLPRAAMAGGTSAQKVVPVKDGPYHHLPWQDADDEGIGGHRR
ncbi:hypothetical protein ABT173_42010 [Streptomyces sp. NPDC001795]|uniref:hypothetical protein n=1 Tax=unclassified Streptomyces TaxID=2593676 RepID=UPI003316F31D